MRNPSLSVPRFLEESDPSDTQTSVYWGFFLSFSDNKMFYFFDIYEGDWLTDCRHFFILINSGDQNLANCFLN